MPVPASLTVRTTAVGLPGGPSHLDGEAARPAGYPVHRLDAIHEEVHDDLLELHAIALHKRQARPSRSRVSVARWTCNSRPTSSATSFTTSTTETGP